MHLNLKVKLILFAYNIIIDVENLLKSTKKKLISDFQ